MRWSPGLFVLLVGFSAVTALVVYRVSLVDAPVHPDEVGGTGVDGRGAHAIGGERDAKGAAAATPTAGDRVQAVADVAPTVPGGCGFRGRVVGPDGPVAGVELTLRPWRPALGERTAVTDTNGRFAVAAPESRWSFELVGPSLPWRWRIDNVQLSARRVLDLGDLRVPPTVRVDGRVVDRAGTPVAGVRVYATSGDGFALGVLDPDDARADPSDVTDERGEYTIGGVRAGAVRVRCEHEGFRGGSAWREECRPGSERIPDLVVEACTPVRGYVLDPSGRPLEGVTVTPGGGRFSVEQPRFAVVTAADGTFSIADISGGRAMLEKDGYAPTLAEFDRERQPVALRMQPALRVRGRVVGAAGKNGTVRIDNEPGEYVERPGALERYVYSEQPLRADGTFDLAHVPAGKWLIEARVPGVGSVAPQPFRVPSIEPLVLEPVPDRVVAVTVVDDAGQPVPDADLLRVAVDSVRHYREKSPHANARTWSTWGHGEQLSCDASGSARVSVPAHEPLMLAAYEALHVSSSVLFDVDEVPEHVRIELPRAGVVAGSLRDPSLCGRVGIGVRVERLAEGQPVTEVKVAYGVVDAAGRFVSSPVPPGRYRLSLVVQDRSAGLSASGALPIFDPVPVIGGMDAIGEAPEIEVLAGKRTEAELAGPSCAEVTGTVRADGRPVAGALLYGRVVDGVTFGDPDEPVAGSYNPNCRSDDDGRFRFLVTTTSPIELRVRLDSSPAWASPVTLQLGPGERVTRDLELSTASLSGRFDLSDLAIVERSQVQAQLYALADAAVDPFYMAFHGEDVPMMFRVQGRDLDGDGRFRFDGVQKGTWVLRIVSGLQNILVQRVVHYGGEEQLDLGMLSCSGRVVPRLTCGLTAQYTVVCRLVVSGSAAGAYAGTAGVDHEAGRWRWPELAPGAYVLEARSSDAWPAAAPPAGHVVRVQVAADGTCTPAVAWPDGL